MANNRPKRDRVIKEALECRVQLLAYARAFTPDHASAEDVVQEAMLVVFNKYEQFEEGTSILAWCRKIVRIEILRMIQRQRKDQSLARRLLHDSIESAFEEHQSKSRSQDEEPWRRQLEWCMNRLSQRARDLVNSRFVDRLAYREIGERLGMKLETVRKSLFRTKKTLRACVETGIQAGESR